MGGISSPPDGVPYLLLSVPGGVTLDRSRLPRRILGEWSHLVDVGGNEDRFSQNRFTGSALADFDGDGALDLAVMPMSNTTRGLIFLNDGAGNFNRRPPIDLPTPLYGAGYSIATRTPTGHINFRDFGTTAWVTRAADLNDDGRPDLVTIETPARTGAEFYRGGRVHIMLNGPGGFSTASTTLGFDAAGNYDSYGFLDLVDITGDARLDILAYRVAPSFLETHVFANRGAGVFERITPAGLPERHYWVALHRAPGTPLQIAALEFEGRDFSGPRPTGVLHARL